MGVGTVGATDGEFFIASYLSSDSITSFPLLFNMQIQDIGAAGYTLNETYTLRLTTLPAAATASFPRYLGWLVAGLLLGLGVKMMKSGPLRVEDQSAKHVQRAS